MSTGHVVAAEERAMFLEAVQALARDRIASLAATIDESDVMAPEALSVLAGSELFHVDGAIDVGGAGGDLVTAISSIGVLAEWSGAVAVRAAATHTFAAACRAGNEAASEHLPGIAEGRSPAIVGFAEGAVRAHRTPHGYELEGNACPAEDGDDDGQLLILATTDTAPTAFLVDARAVRGHAPRCRTGLRGIARRIVDVSGLSVSDETSIGGAASVVAARHYRVLAGAAIGLGLARAAIRESTTYLQDRRQFGRPLWQFAGLRGMVADMEDRAACAAGLVRAAATDPNALTSPAARVVDRAGRVATTTSVSVCRAGVQLHGGYGYTTEFAVERLMRDAISARARLAVGSVR